MNDVKKKCLIYAHYYIPDVASTAQLISEVAEGLTEEYMVTVICVVPSYEGTVSSEYKAKKFYAEKLNGVRVIRVRVPEFSKSDKTSRIKNIMAYFLRAREATRIVSKEKFDYVLTISQPPLLGGMLGVYGKKKLRTSDGKHPKLIYNIQDFNPEQIMAVGYFKNVIALKIMMMIDKRSCRRSDLIITVGRDLVKTVEKRFFGKKIPKTVMINNWINDKEVYPLSKDNEKVLEFKKEYGIEKDFIIMYSGNIGLYYDLEGLIKVVGKFKNSRTPDGRNVIFAFVGTGSVLDKLKKYKYDHNLNNVVFIPYQDKDKLIYSLNAGDVHWCVNAKGIKGVSCPSKFYGIASVGKPIIGVLEDGSEVKLLIDEIGCGKVSEPSDYLSIERNIAWFISNADNEKIVQMGLKGYEYLTKFLTKEVSIKKYIDTIKKI